VLLMSVASMRKTFNSKAETKAHNNSPLKPNEKENRGYVGKGSLIERDALVPFKPMWSARKLTFGLPTINAVTPASPAPSSIQYPPSPSFGKKT